jgi:hypothetical protein
LVLIKGVFSIIATLGKISDLVEAIATRIV